MRVENSIIYLLWRISYPVSQDAHHAGMSSAFIYLFIYLFTSLSIHSFINFLFNCYNFIITIIFEESLTLLHL